MKTIRTGAAILFMLIAGTLFASQFRNERIVLPSGEGPNILDVDVPLLSGAKPLRYAEAKGSDTFHLLGGLEDLRLFDAAGKEVPYLVVPPESGEAHWKEGRVLDVASTKTTSGFEADLGASSLIDRIRVSGLDAPFLKRFRLEGSGDREHWTVLVESGTLFDLPEEHLRKTDASFPAGEYRYLRVTWDDRSSSRVGKPASVEAREVRRPLPPRPFVPVRFSWRASEPRKSRIALRLPGRNLPVTAIDIQVARGHVLRDAVITEARFRSGEVAPVNIGHAVLRRAERGEDVAQELRIPVDRPHGTDLELLIEDGDNPPLAITGVEAELAPLPQIYFESRDGAPITARYGEGDLSRPHYDLEAARDSVDLANASRARWGEPKSIAAVPEMDAAIRSAPPAGPVVHEEDFGYKRNIPAIEPGMIAIQLDLAALAHSNGLKDIRVVDEKEKQIPYVIERRGEPLEFEFPVNRVDDEDARRSRYPLVLPYDSLRWKGTLVVETDAPLFERAVTLVASNGKEGRDDGEVVVERKLWQHTEPETAAPPISFDVPLDGHSAWELTIEEGDNPPLPIRRIRLLLPSYRVRLFHPPGSQLTMLYGNPHADAPRYDLELMRARIVGMDAAEITPGEEIVNAGLAAERPARIFWGIIVAAAIVLLALLAKLLQHSERQPKQS
ncbi:MAG: DUF3999 family protein [Thermoanaerobaculia bacterium]